jgi:hypothetical protein
MMVEIGPNLASTLESLAVGFAICFVIYCFLKALR